MQEKKKKKKNQLGYKSKITVEIYAVTVEILYMNSVIDPLIWVIFEQKCVKLITFCILQSLVLLPLHN